MYLLCSVIRLLFGLYLRWIRHLLRKMSSYLFEIRKDSEGHRDQTFHARPSPRGWQPELTSITRAVCTKWMSPKSIHRYGKLKIISLLNKEKEKKRERVSNCMPEKTFESSWRKCRAKLQSVLHINKYVPKSEDVSGWFWVSLTIRVGKSEVRREKK